MQIFAGVGGGVSPITVDYLVQAGGGSGGMSAGGGGGLLLPKI